MSYGLSADMAPVEPRVCLEAGHEVWGAKVGADGITVVWRGCFSPGRS